MKLDSCPRLATHVIFKKDVISHEPMLLFPEGVLVLNDTSEEIVRKCSGKVSVAEIIADLSREYEVEPAVIEADVLECLTDLFKRKLILCALPICLPTAPSRSWPN
jgi:pyrroloquinoline quinone biosynthesis protein D